MYINLTKYKNHVNKPQLFANAYSNLLAKIEDEHNYHLPQDKLKAIKSWPFIYWISDEFRESFAKPTVEQVLKAASGTSTGITIDLFDFGGKSTLKLFLQIIRKIMLNGFAMLKVDHLIDGMVMIG